MNKRESLFRILLRLRFITLTGMFQWMHSFFSEGVTLMAALRFAKRFYSEQCALVCDGQRFTYRELYFAARRLAQLLYTNYDLRRRMQVALFCRNHTLSVLLLPALSRLGVHIKLLNTDMSSENLAAYLQRGKVSLLIYDYELQERCSAALPACKAVTSETLSQLLFDKKKIVLNKKLTSRVGKPVISVLTGGTSGIYKEAGRRSSATQFLSPFFALLKDVRIYRYSGVFLSLPLYHGFGLATLIISLLMGKKICMMRRFDASEALAFIRQEAIEVLPIVPAMLARMWQNENVIGDLQTVKCMISGGDRLDKKWVETVHQQLGKILYNLYGTSEAGFFMLATPQDLEANEEVTIGKPIRGVVCQLREVDPQGVGTLWVRSRWAMQGRGNHWQSTGDLMWCNPRGYYFHRGRADQMVVCGGENVYPEHVERVLSQHHEVVAAQVYAVEHAQFGHVLEARVELVANAVATSDSIKRWLVPRISRAEMPHRILLQTIPLLSTGKRKAINGM